MNSQAKHLSRVGSGAGSEPQPAPPSCQGSLVDYKALIEGIPGAVYSYSLKSGGIYYSPQVVHLLGYTPEELRAQPNLWRASIHPDDQPLLQAVFREIAAGKPFCTEYRIRTAQGEWRWLVDRSITYGREGDDVIVHGFAVDITARRATEEKFRALSMAVEQSPASIVITDTQGSIEYVNARFTQVTGYTTAEVLGKNPRILKGEKTSAKEYQFLWQTITGGKEWRGEFHNRKKSGELYWELASISPIVDATGKITHFLAIKEDITHRRELEESLRQAQKMKSIGALAGGIAHDFNNILAATMIHLGLLLKDPRFSPEMQAALKSLMSDARRAADLTRQLLMFSRKSVLNVKVLDLNDVVTHLLELVRRLIGEHISIRFEPCAGLPAVEADSSMMEQVVMNLAVNARDAMPEGGDLLIELKSVRVRASQIRPGFDAKPGVFACLSVEDTGHGMDDATLERLFEPFFTTKQPGRGTGLGLATVHGIIAQHKGFIDVRSSPGKGTRFSVFLPATEKSPGSEPTDTLTIVRGRETILLVEDESSMRMAAGLSLRAMGYAVLEADSGPGALRVWLEHRERIDLLFTDVVMPGGITGLELADRMTREKPALKVMLTSGYNPEMAAQNLPAARGLHFLQKPYEITTLAKAIREVLDASPRSSAW